MSLKSTATQPIIPNGVMGICLFIITEVMYFLSLISAYWIIRSEYVQWPPWGQPRLPVTLTAFNTAILLFSGFLIYWFLYQWKHNQFRIFYYLAGTALGFVFLFIQGYEWIQLIHFKLTLDSSNYGSIFYLIVGSHALHVLATLVVMLKFAWDYFNQGQLDRTNIQVVSIFWYFVVAVWPVLYVVVYLF